MVDPIRTRRIYSCRWLHCPMSTVGEIHFLRPSIKHGLAWRNTLKLAQTCSRAMLNLGSNQDPSG